MKLTVIERAILTGIAGGLTYKQISRNSGTMNPATVRSRMTRIRMKLDADTNPHAVALAIRRGILS